ncbi:MAG TPA: hypothetical protein PKE00_12490, partial [Planctomycetota bacterium]|nr:hypothetical protein [Planctomycetota bacterium]
MTARTRDRSALEEATISVIVPFKEGAAARAACEPLSSLVGLASLVHEVIVAADSTLSDAAVKTFEGHGLRVHRSDAPRGARTASAARASSGSGLLFLHADTRLAETAITNLEAAFRAGAQWGAFRLRFEDEDGRSCLALVAAAANLRSKCFGLPYGDQAQWCRRDAYEEVGGHPPWSFLDDYELAKRLRAIARPWILEPEATTSARRYRQNGIIRCVLRNQLILARHALGADPNELAKAYRRKVDDALSRDDHLPTVKGDG